MGWKLHWIAELSIFHRPNYDLHDIRLLCNRGVGLHLGENRFRYFGGSRLEFQSRTQHTGGTPRPRLCHGYWDHYAVESRRPGLLPHSSDGERGDHLGEAEENVQ